MTDATDATGLTDGADEGGARKDAGGGADEGGLSGLSAQLDRIGVEHNVVESTVVVVLPGYEHGLHVGDLVAIVISYAAAAILTFVLPPSEGEDGVDAAAVRAADDDE